MANILLGVTGSIAAYKAVDIANILTKKGHDVRCILTDAGAKFVKSLSLQTVSRNKVYTDLFCEENPKEVTHIALSEWADMGFVAPASANTIAKITYGFADNLLTSTVLALNEKQLVICPAMNTKMYQNQITQENIEKLKKRNVIVLGPEKTDLACGSKGMGGLIKTKNFIQKFDDILYTKANDFLKELVRKQNEKYYEIVECSHDFDNGLMLIAYDDTNHNYEKYHICINIDEPSSYEDVGIPYPYNQMK